jgi:hypothetical protein
MVSGICRQFNGLFAEAAELTSHPDSTSCFVHSADQNRYYELNRVADDEALWMLISLGQKPTDNAETMPEATSTIVENGLGSVAVNRFIFKTQPPAQEVRVVRSSVELQELYVAACGLTRVTNCMDAVLLRAQMRILDSKVLSRAQPVLKLPTTPVAAVLPFRRKQS